MEIVYLLFAILFIVLLTTRLKVHPFIALLVISIAYGIFSGMPYQDIITAINEGFGGTLGKIGLIIVLGVIIGAFLENTGGAYTIAQGVLKLIGKKRIPLAMGLIGYVVSIPVFADSGFMLLHPLNKGLSKKAGISFAGAAIALGLGLMASHTMVPPTPGPIAAAGILQANLGLVIAFGIPVSLLALSVAILFAIHYAAKTYIDPELGETVDSLADKAETEAPGIVRSSIPIVVPIMLIVLKSIFWNAGAGRTHLLLELIGFLGEPIIALLIGVFLCLLLPKKLHFEMLSSSGWTGKAIKDAASKK